MLHFKTHLTNILHRILKNVSIYVLLLFLMCFHTKLLAQSYDYDYKENAVYVYNFIKYTTWPSGKENITIGIIGYTPFTPEFRRLLLKKKSGNLSITLKYIKPSESNAVDVVLIAVEASDKLRDVYTLTNKLPILIITEKGNLSRQGACISLFIDEDDDFKTRYQLSVRNCNARGLHISEQILNNAILVR